MNLSVPMDVPARSRERYRRRYQALTAGTGRLMLFAGDQKVEHLNQDFFGTGISAQDADPEHLFRIASHGRIGVFAAQMGLISRYGMDYPDVPYLVKLNSKTNLVETQQADPYSAQWMEVSQVQEIAEESGLNILGVGYTVYLGSEEESSMLAQAAQIVTCAHREGLLTVLWMYPRGRAVRDERDPHLIAGACGVAAALGSDFVKVNYPRGPQAASDFREAVLAAGRTGVVCAGGSSDSPHAFLSRLHDQIHISGAAGNATGRNIHQKSLEEAVRMCNAIYSITVENRSLEEAMEVLEG
ncbi:MAG: Fructose-bisphosphate aldolase/6-deoxy-5-ketofructose 1-phosphate synthase [Methanosaeta sp. PtaB.Bin039]|nr:MAG: Fructose-bisphosphate aldolase/6-deoxy-5-ketofructose 1-phosphate synthase [Methanosaeta sp. PtaB.Bin039]OPY46091.1 MAG: Fructose-bisphosphate aldolase/6-deoxy-5-ketofructose 1-phosphate synthase [Methanosaeta sp. PtaU1.Bin028]HOT06032.1 aldolase [Methanotrichaceae archaeon]HQF16318.1 aldolase [Methanotrichaceae archaeon]HQI90090.1 aldolase [Methanotrichaceae archaeon]